MDLTEWLFFREMDGKLDRVLHEIREHRREIMASIKDLADVVEKLKADTSTTLKDILAKLAAIPTTDPAVQAGIDQAVADLTALDATVTGADPGATA